MAGQMCACLGIHQADPDCPWMSRSDHGPSSPEPLWRARPFAPDLARLAHAGGPPHWVAVRATRKGHYRTALATIREAGASVRCSKQSLRSWPTEAQRALMQLSLGYSQDTAKIQPGDRTAMN